MRLESPCLLQLLIFGWIFSARNCQTYWQQKSFDDTLLQIVCTLECPNDSPCEKNCIETKKKIKALDEEAGANARIFCQDKDFLLLAHNLGLLVVEQRTGTWISVGVTSATDSNTTVRYHETPGYHHIVVYRLSPSGISKPEKVIVVPMKPDGYRPKQVPNVTLGRSFFIDRDRDEGTWQQEISFTPSQDRPCYYEVRCQQDNGNYSETIDIAESEIFNVTFSGLPSEGDFTVGVRALTKALKDSHSMNVTATTVAFTTRRYSRPPHRKNFDVLISCLVGTILVVIGTGIGVYKYLRIRRSRITHKASQADGYELSPDRLVITRVLGNGAFGVVKFGRLRDDKGHRIDVAVKMLRDDSNKDHTHNFQLEIKMMKALDKHPNIVSFLGCCSTGPYPFLVLEYCSQGDLHSFLRKSLLETKLPIDDNKKCIVDTRKFPRRKEVIVEQETLNSKGFPQRISMCQSSNGYIDVSISIEDQNTSCALNIVTLLDMLNFGRQIAKGMDFLSLNKIVHRDLAARNILVCHNRTVKISDFGLSRDVYGENIYKKCGNGRMPLKWMAIESLTHQVYSTHSDVWSFGVLLWEILTLGGDPYPGVPTIEILKQLQSGYRMERPENCSVHLYEVMLACWQTRPRDRPTFAVLHQELDKLISANAENRYFDLEGVSKETVIEVNM